MRRRYLPGTSSILALTAGALGAEFDSNGVRAQPFEPVSSIAVVEIRGPLLQHLDWCWDSYEAIAERVTAALASPAKVVVLRIDSPGGDALGVFETARELAALAAAAGKQLVAYADGMIASAAYALACSCSAIYVPAAGFVGSIGVLQPVVDQSAADRAMGLRFDFVSSGERKTDGNPHVPLTDEARASIQARVDSLAELFFELVGETRGVKPEAVRALNGAVFHGKAAVAAKLADGVLSWNELLAMLAASGTPKATAANTETDMDKKEMRAWLAKMAEGTGEEAEKAKAALKCFDGEDKPADEKKDEKKEEAKAEDAAPPPPEKKDKEEDDSPKALLALTAQVHAMQAERAKEIEDKERDRLFALRPDFSAQTRSTLAKVSLATVKEAVETWPKIVGLVAHDATVQGTRGKDQGDENARPAKLPADESLALQRRMGLSAAAPQIVRVGHEMQFPVISPEAAREVTNAKKMKVA